MKKRRAWAKEHRKLHPEIYSARSKRWRDKYPGWYTKYKGKYKYYRPETNMKSSLKYHYNITPEQYHQMFETQHGVCAICKQPETSKYKGKTKRLAVDHSHITGKVRGLLCKNCNVQIAIFDNEPLYNKAMEYLNKYD